MALARDLPYKSIYTLDLATAVFMMILIILAVFIICILFDMLRKIPLRSGYSIKSIRNYEINIVIPCYNEQEVLTKTIEVLGKLSGRIKQETAVDTQLLLVDDGSNDKTWSMIKEAAKTHSLSAALNFLITEDIRMHSWLAWRLPSTITMRW